MSDIKIDEIRRQLQSISKGTGAEEANPQNSFSEIFESEIKKDENVQNTEKTENRDANISAASTLKMHETLNDIEEADNSYKKIMEVKENLVNVYKNFMNDDNK